MSGVNCRSCQQFVSHIIFYAVACIHREGGAQVPIVSGAQVPKVSSPAAGREVKKSCEFGRSGTLLQAVGTPQHSPRLACTSP